MKLKSFLVFIILGMTALTARAQIYELGLFGGGAYYLGDLNRGPQGQFNNTEPAFGGFFRYNMDNHLSARVNLMHGNVSGSDQDSPFSILENDEVFHFETTITELSVQGEVNFLPYITGEEESLFSPYIFGGMGYLFFDGDYGIGDQSHLETAERPDVDNNISVTFLFGAGLKYYLTPNISGGLEWGLRKTGTDYLDQVSLRGNPRGDDWYGFAGLSLSVKIIDRSRARCPHPPF